MRSPPIQRFPKMVELSPLPPAVRGVQESTSTIEKHASYGTSLKIFEQKYAIQRLVLMVVGLPLNLARMVNGTLWYTTVLGNRLICRPLSHEVVAKPLLLHGSCRI